MPKPDLPSVPNIAASMHDDTSHIHSAPLVLALLPAAAGMLVTNGNIFVTDITILLIGAVLLNWCVKLPWYVFHYSFKCALLIKSREWYRSAQATRLGDGEDEHYFGPIMEEDGEDDLQEDALASSREMSPPPPAANKKGKGPEQHRPPEYEAASVELRMHELIALGLCFLGPVIGAFLLHTIRDQLSRPSEGLVSNYNLTIFLLASELRPFIHLIKMIQGRTLHLQRIVTVTPVAEETKLDPSKVLDLTKRLEELEAHVAEQADTAQKQAALENSTAKTAAQVTTDVRKGVQPELDALNRAVRRYEKRTTVASIQTDARLHELETRVKDAISLAASAQRNAQNQPQNYAMTLMNWACAAVVLPVESAHYVSTLPARLAAWGLATTKTLLGLNKRRVPKYTGQPRPASRGPSRVSKKVA